MRLKTVPVPLFIWIEFYPEELFDPLSLAGVESGHDVSQKSPAFHCDFFDDAWFAGAATVDGG
jgi:hypothetical protein